MGLFYGARAVLSPRFSPLAFLWPHLPEALSIHDTHSEDAYSPKAATEKHKDEEGAGVVQISERVTGVNGGGSILDDGEEDAQLPAFIELKEDASVFANCKSWKIKYHAKEQHVFIPLSTPKHYDGYGMIPVFGGGAIQKDFVRPYPAAVIISSVRSRAGNIPSSDSSYIWLQACRFHEQKSPHINAHQ
jgi:hypothetical protein